MDNSRFRHLGGDSSQEIRRPPHHSVYIARRASNIKGNRQRGPVVNGEINQDAGFFRFDVNLAQTSQDIVLCEHSH
jgi:hypothetical protein